MQKNSMKTVWHSTWTWQDLENNIPQSAWEMVAPNIGQDDTITHLQGFSTLQNEKKKKKIQ